MSRLPRELIDFPSQDNNILLVKGDPGTGKTILSLELLRKFGGDKNGIYLSTRVSPDRLLNQFPWLVDVVRSEHVLETSTAKIEKGFRVSDSTIREFPTVLEHFYELAIGVENPFIVVDSWDAITENLEPEQIRTTMKILETLVASKNANLVFVSETTEQTTLDFLADGVVTLSQEELDGRRIRVMELNKLRGIEITQHRHPFTLESGRFQQLPVFTQTHPEKPGRWESIPDSETRFSTGMRDLDGVLGGGFPRGSYNLLEVGEDVPTPEYVMLSSCTLLNFLNNGNGVVMIPPCGIDPRSARNLLEPFLDSEVFGRMFWIFHYGEESKEPYTIPLTGESILDDYRAFWQAINKFHSETHKPVLTLVGVDTIESVRGKEAFLKVLGRTVANVRRTGVRLNVAKPSVGSLPQLREISDTHIKLTEIEGRPCLYGVKPRTPIYGVEINLSKGYPDVKLTPIV